VTGQRMRAFDDPVDLVVYMLEKTRSIAVLKALENRSDVVFGESSDPPLYMRAIARSTQDGLSCLKT
jgi:hypothetical protein